MKISHRVVSFCFLALLALGTSSFAQDEGDDAPDDTAPPMAQNAPEAPPIPNAAARVYTVEEDNLAGLPGVLSRGNGPGAVSLQVDDETLNGDAAARAALLRYVSQGGTVFLHTDAAREFGYVTVQAREGTNQVAGQLYGRARAAMPFGAHPLLWDDGVAPVRRSPNADPTLLPGVNLVYYQLRSGDDLVVSNPAGTPLLQVSDLGAGGGPPLYAAAIAPFGRGFAVFTPDTIDTVRGDGALFARNLLGLLTPAVGVGRKLVGVPARLIQDGANSPVALQRALVQAVKDAGPGYVPALPAFGTAPASPPPTAAVPPLPAVPPANATPQIDFQITPDDGQDEGQDDVPDDTPAIGPVAGDAQVMMGRSEAATYARLLAGGGARADLATDLLRARLFLSQSDPQAASQALDAAQGFAAEGSPDAAAIALWRGVILAEASQPIAQSSTARAQNLMNAAQSLAFAARGIASPVNTTATNAAATNAAVNNPNARPVPDDSGISAAMLQGWSVKFAQIAQAFALEPPAFTQYGVGDGSIILRGYPIGGDTQSIDTALRALANARNFGWHTDHEEIVLFPSIPIYAQYRRLLGLGAATVPLPVGSGGDVLGQRIIMASAPFFTPVETDPNTGEQRPFAGGNNTSNIFGRLQAYVMLNALDEGGSNVPVYLRLGLENTVNRIINGTGFYSESQILQQFAQNGGLLTPNQFRTNEADPVRYELAQLEASGIVAYLYNQHGPGAMVETLQRLGAGENIDDALQATTNGNQLDLFRDWRTAQFGPQRFPNRG